MRPKQGQLDHASQHDQIPEWWDAEPTHEELLAVEAENAKSENRDKDTTPNKWVQDAMNKGPKPF